MAENIKDSLEKLVGNVGNLLPPKDASQERREEEERVDIRKRNETEFRDRGL